MRRRAVGIIVDGPGDRAALRRRLQSTAALPYHILITSGPRGHTVSVDQLVGGARKQIEILASLGCTTIVLLFDFETRSGTYKQFVEAVQRELSLGAHGAVAVSPNRMIENWYLADIEYLSKRRAFIRDKLRQKAYEGTNGKQQLRRLFKAGIPYSETEHGPQLFELIRFPRAAANSRSFAHFLHVLRQGGAPV